MKSHHGDLTYYDGKIYVAVEFGKFNEPAGQTDSWIFVYDADDLRLISKHAMPELIHGCGGIAYGGGRFIVVGGLPSDHQQNYVFEYDNNLRFLKRHILPTGQTRLGIQTAAFFDDHWWFGCYGSPNNPGLLKANQELQLVGTSIADFSYGIVRLDKRTILRGEVSSGGRQGYAVLLNEIPQVQTIHNSRQKKSIVALGDSITRGVREGVANSETFCSVLQQRLQRSGHQVKIVNLGIGGERTDQALSRLSEVIKSRPHLMTIMYGTNDSYVDAGKTDSRISVTEYRSNLLQIISRLRDAQIVPILMTPPRWSDSAKRNGIGENPNVQLAPYVAACRDVARQNNVVLVDHFAIWEKAADEGQNLHESTTDGCHPNPAGHKKMASTMVPTIAKLLDAQP